MGKKIVTFGEMLMRLTTPGNLRLQQASRMLKSSDMTIAEVCYAVGFTSHSYFTKCYREYFGELPSESQKRTSKIRS